MGESEALWERIDPVAWAKRPDESGSDPAAGGDRAKVQQHPIASSTVEAHIAGIFCPLCNNENPFRIQPLQCAEGHAPLLLSWQWESEDEYEGWYADPTAYHVDEQVSQGQRSCTDSQRRSDAWTAAAKRLQAILFYKEPAARLLDIGCGTGEFVRTANNFGYVAYGIDPNPALASGDKVITAGTWKDVEGLWDIITLHDVFEHLTRPREALRHLYGHLSDRGIVVVEQPEWDSPHQRAAGMEWKHIRPRQHICLYSKGAFEQLAEEEGFEAFAFYRPLRSSLGKMVHILQRVS